VSRSGGEELFLIQVAEAGLETPQSEHKFLDKRRFRFDFAWPDRMLAVEIEGGVWVGGRHTRGAGYSRDMEKYNLALLHGWSVYRFTTQDVHKGVAISFIKGVMDNNKLKEQSYEDIRRGLMFSHTVQSPKSKASSKS
jgi:hypothetical protein